MSEPTHEQIAGEHALRTGEADRLGFGEVAKRIATSIVDRASIDGLVVGLDGEWGSGKSSLLHLIERSLGQLPTDMKPTVINFRPWLVGNRDALLNSLFSELAEKMARVSLARGDASQITKQRAAAAARRVLAFGRAIGKAGELVEAVGDFLPGAGIGGRFLGGLGTWLEKEKEPTDLASLKAQITSDLSQMDHRFVITIDDVDRLEPAEVIEVLRLVRSVADFPNIIYLLCYDAARLAEAIESGAKVKSGVTYLEKIVQLTVMVPKPEPFQLRQWFSEELEKIVGSVSGYEGRERLKLVIDREGAIQLRTPRSVVRTLDSIRFFWPAMRDEKIDVADLVWLQLIKDGSPNLYRWIETYVASAAAQSFGTTTISDAGKEARLAALLELASDGQLKDVMYRHMFGEVLPGIEANFGEDGPPVNIHEKSSPQDRQEAINGRRLASPDHYRLYFSLIGPSHAITQAGFDDFWMAVDSGPDRAADVLLNLQAQMALGALRKSDVLFERLKNADASVWAEPRAKNFLVALGRMMDEAYRQNPSEENFIVSSWDRAEKLVPILYAQLSDVERLVVNEELFGEAPALGWLTSLFRRETFAHGKYGNRARPSEHWLIPEAEFERACELMIARYRSMTIDEVLATPRPLHILFAWNQGGDEEGPRKLIASATESDEGLVTIYEAFTSSIDSSDRGRFTVLKRENVEPFADYDVVRSRLAAIATSGPPELRKVAQELSGAADAADY